MQNEHEIPEDVPGDVMEITVSDPAGDYVTSQPTVNEVRVVHLGWTVYLNGNQVDGAKDKTTAKTKANAIAKANLPCDRVIEDGHGNEQETRNYR